MRPKEVLICHRVADVEPLVASTVDECNFCHAAVWRAVSSPNVGLIMCSACLTHQAPNGATIGPLSRAQITDIEKYFKAQ
jgi:hypothetical protein